MGARAAVDAAARQANGAACTRATDCTSFRCVDGFCCDSSCTGQCQACNLPGLEGTCTPVSGEPVGNRPACSGNPPCAAVCDGLTTSHCAGYPGAETSRGASTCADGVQSTHVCSGAGVADQVACDPYLCDPAGDSFLTTCLTNDQCVAAANCVGRECATGVCCASACDGACVDPATFLTDPLNRGSCGIACGINEASVEGFCESTCAADLEACAVNEECCSDACTRGDNAQALRCLPETYFEDFSAGVGEWEGTISASGGVGIVGTDGSPFTRLGGYSSVWPDGGFTVSLDVYLDMAANPSNGTDLRLDYTVAINQPSCAHQRDFVFNIGTDPLTAVRFAASVSNNADGWPSNPARVPFFFVVTGWYTLTHVFYDAGGGVLAADLTISGPGGSKTWTLSDASDVIEATVGGHRYAWFASNDFTGLMIDNSARS